MEKWHTRCDGDSYLCNMRHNARYYAEAHDTTSKRLQLKMDWSYLLFIPKDFWSRRLLLGLFFSGCLIGILSLIKGYLKYGKRDLGILIFLLTLLIGVRNMLTVQIQRHKVASGRWRNLYEDADYLILYPKLNPNYPFEEFDKDLFQLKEQKKKLDYEVDKTIDIDFKIVYERLDKDFRDQDKEKLNQIYS
jgi:hypothetical protein